MVVKKTQRSARVPPKNKRPAQHARKYKIQMKEKEVPKKDEKNKKALVIAQEIKFAKLLAGNDKKDRDKVLKNLRKWLMMRSQSSFAFTEADFMRLWKGLYYCMWMSDKPLIQEELAESLSKLVHCFKNKETALLYAKCTLRTLAAEWFGIDQHRLDKFQMLVRRIVRQIFEMCKKRSWNREWVDGLEKVIEELLLDKKTTLGFNLHVTELYMEELAKVSGGNLPEEVVTELVRPFAIQLAGMDDERQIRHVMKHIFRHLLFQSDVGLDYVEKFKAWSNAGFPEGNIDAMQKIEVSDDEDDGSSDNEKDDVEDQNNVDEPVEKPLDPRAGRVDVELPQLPFNPKSIADLVMEYRFHPSSTTRTRRQIVKLAKEFSELSEGKMPLGVKEVKVPDARKTDMNPRKAALQLIEFERELYSDTVHGRRKKKKKNGEILPKNEGEDEDIDASTDAVAPKKRAKIDDDSNDYASKNGVHLGELDEENEEEIEETPKRKRGNKNNSKKQTVQQNGQPDISVDGRTEAEETEDLPKKNKINKNKKKRQSLQSNVDLAKGGESELANSSRDKRLNNKIKKSEPEQLDCELNDGIDDFNNFMKSITPVKLKSPKRESLVADWDISVNNSPPTPSTPPSKERLRRGVSPGRTENMSPRNGSQSLDMDTSSAVRSDKDILRSKGVQWLTPVLTKLGSEPPKSVTPKTPQGQSRMKTTPSSSSKKRVKIVLQRNTAQHTSEYMRQLRQSPAIPYDANRKPGAGVLKPSPIPSPVNPFYKRNMK